MIIHFHHSTANNPNWMIVDGVTTSYTYNNLDQLTNAGSITYQYNGRGDLTQITNGSNVTNYTWNAADKLATVTLPDTTNIAYTYDTSGHRVKQTIGSQITNYLWDEASTYEDVVLETNGSGATVASYVLGETELLSQTRSNVTSYYLQEGQGSTRNLTNATGSITDTYSYTAYGEIYSQTGSTTNPYLYTGQQYDSATELYSLRARYYAPSVGRFLSRDVQSYNFSNPIELNRYFYTANNPINTVDPTGLFAMVEYSMTNSESEEEGAALEPVGEEFASEAETVVEETADEFESTQTWDTSENARILRRNIKDGDVLGRLKNPGDFAHHIVPSTDPDVAEAQQVLDSVKIDINSKSNGLWLDRATHNITFRDAYLRAVNKLIVEAGNSGGGKVAVEEALKFIARGLLSGTFP